MIHITPNYSKEIKCYYCNKRSAHIKSGYTEEFYCITKKHVFPLGYSYTTIKVDVPRCKKCEKIHLCSIIPGIIAFLILSSLFGYFLIVNCEWNEEWYYITLAILTSLLFGGLTGYIIGYIPYLSISKINKIKYENNTDHYSPIRKLLGNGIIRNKPDPSKSSGIKCGYDEKRLNETLESISTKDNCIIKNT